MRDSGPKQLRKPQCHGFVKDFLHERGCHPSVLIGNLPQFSSNVIPSLTIRAFGAEAREQPFEIIEDEPRFCYPEMAPLMAIEQAKQQASNDCVGC